jgi:hypothetical protein
MVGDDLDLSDLEASQTVERILKLKREMNVLRARWRSYNGGIVGKEEPQPATAREEEETQPEGVEKNRKKVVVIKRRLVPQQLVDYMMENPHDPWNGYPQEQLVNRSQKFLEYYAREKAYHDKFSEYQQALINQYHDNSFVEDYMEMEVSDNDDKN